MNNTISYYNTNTSSFVESTQSVQMTEAWSRFTSKLSESSIILDFGCGSGRDTKYFLEHGFQVEAIDGSEFEENYIEENDLDYGFQWDDDFYDYCREYFLDECGYDIKFNKNNCVYCERAIAVESNFDPKKYIDKYKGHLGVYWTYEKDNADAVDGTEDNIIVLSGYVKPEDCDWAETITANLLDPDEMELTIKEDADVLITNIKYNDEDIFTSEMICKA